MSIVRCAIVVALMGLLIVLFLGRSDFSFRGFDLGAGARKVATLSVHKSKPSHRGKTLHRKAARAPAAKGRLTRYRNAAVESLGKVRADIAADRKRRGDESVLDLIKITPEAKPDQE